MSDIEMSLSDQSMTKEAAREERIAKYGFDVLDQSLWKTFSSKKQVKSVPMARGLYNDYRDFPQVEGENPDDAGYLIEYLDGGKSNHPDHQGYISWSPKDVFDRNHEELGRGETPYMVTLDETPFVSARAMVVDSGQPALIPSYLPRAMGKFVLQGNTVESEIEQELLKSELMEGFAYYNSLQNFQAKPATWAEWYKEYIVDEDHPAPTKENQAGYVVFRQVGKDRDNDRPVYAAQPIWMPEEDFLNGYAFAEVFTGKAPCGLIANVPMFDEASFDPNNAPMTIYKSTPLENGMALGTVETLSAPNGELTFSDALTALKFGYRVQRAGWNGKDMWLSVSNLNTATVDADKFWSPHNSEYAKNNGGSAEVPPCITMKNAKGQIQMGWLPSQEDCFSSDWFVFEKED